MYCCNVSGIICVIALWASHMYSHRGIWQIRNAFIMIIIIQNPPVFQCVAWKPDMATNLQAFHTEHYLWCSDWLKFLGWLAAREPSIRLLYIYIDSWGESSVTADSVTCITVLDSPWVRPRREWVCGVPCLTGTKGYCGTYLVGLTAIPPPENIQNTELSGWVWYISPNGLLFHRQR